MEHFRPRVEERVKVLIRARIRAGTAAERDSCILDLSSRGMLLTMAVPPAHGAFVEVLAQGHSLVGHVEWSNGRRCGIRLRERINHLALIAGEDGPIVIRERVARLATRGGVEVAALDSQRFSAISRFVLTLAAGAAAAMLLADIVGNALGGVFGSAGNVMAAPGPANDYD